jgi:hypothetical protein
MTTKLITVGMLTLAVGLGACASQSQTGSLSQWHNPGVTQAQANQDNIQCHHVADTNAQLMDRSAQPSSRDQMLERQRLDYATCMSSRGYIQQGS